MKINALKLKKITKRIFLIFFLIIILFFFLVPYFVMLAGSIKPEKEIQLASVENSSKIKPSFLPYQPTVENYIITLFSGSDFIKFFYNSIIVSSGTTVLTLLISILAAYGLSRFNFKYANVYKIGLFFNQMIPGIAFLLPFYIIFYLINKYTGIPIKSSFIGLILTYTVFSLPFSILMLTKFFNSIPFDYDDQAMIDGCTRFKALFKIIVPIAMPGIYTIGIYCFLISWNEILFASMLTNKGSRTISVGILEIWGLGPKLASCVLIAIPVIILFAYFRKYCIAGLLSSSSK